MEMTLQQFDAHDDAVLFGVMAYLITELTAQRVVLERVIIVCDADETAKIEGHRTPFDLLVAEDCRRLYHAAMQDTDGITQVGPQAGRLATAVVAAPLKGITQR